MTYKLTQADYLQAGKITVVRPGRPWARTFSYAYQIGFLLIVWGAFVLGMVLEQSEMVGITAPDANQSHEVKDVILASILPGLTYAYFASLLFRAVLRQVDLRRRREHFRTDPGCTHETTVTLTHESIAFRSATGSSQSDWSGYSTWVERNGLLVRVTKAGVRKIVKTADLTNADRDAVHSLLSAALPRK